jgi:hypothetical protein
MSAASAPNVQASGRRPTPPLPVPEQPMRPTRHLLRTTLLAATLTAGAATVAAAQARPDSAGRVVPAQPPRTPMDSARMQAAMMSPMIGQMMQAMLRSTLAALTEPEVADQMATFSRNYFDALVAKGFTRDEALRIVLAHGIPGLRAGQ